MFRFKQFTVKQDLCAMKVGTDAVLLGTWASVPTSVSHQHVPANGATTKPLHVPAADVPVRPLRILDVGTGTGVIALMMAQRFPTAQVVGVDVDEQAVLQAKDNVAHSPFAERVSVLHERIQAYGLRPEWRGAFDMVVSNPPYFIDSYKAANRRRSTARHAGSLTYGELMEAAWQLLSADGELSVVIPFDYKQRMEDEATFRGFFSSRECAVQTVSGKPPLRYLLAFRKKPSVREVTALTIGSTEFEQLTADFYL